jgi:carbon storage regulator
VIDPGNRGTARTTTARPRRASHVTPLPRRTALVYAARTVLTLTRKPGQKIFIGGGIEIEVREVRGAQVRLGITAPKGLPVYREELYLQIAEANRRSMTDVAVDRLLKIENE